MPNKDQSVQIDVASLCCLRPTWAFLFDTPVFLGFFLLYLPKRVLINAPYVEADVVIDTFYL